MKQILRLTTTLIVLLFLGGSAWGQTYLIQEGFEFTFPPTGWINSASGWVSSTNNPRTGSKSIAANGVNDEIITSKLVDPDNLSFWYRRSSNATAWTLKVYYGSATSGPWTEIGSITNASTTYQEFTYDLSSFSDIYIRLLDLRSTGNHERYVDDFSVTQRTGSIPTITVDPVILTGFTYILGSGPSAAKSFTVTGNDLTAGITVSAAALNYEVSTSEGGAYSSSVVLSTSGGTVWVRLKEGLSVRDYNDEVITATSTGATDKTVTCSGSVTAPPAPDAPTATAATSVGQNDFTANWNAALGATGYRLDVYTKTGGGNATDLFISEYVEGSSNNKAIEIYNGTGASVNLSSYSLKKQSNGSGEFGSELVLSGNIANNDVYVIVLSSGSGTTLEGQPYVDLATTSGALSFNGNDAVALCKSGVQIDVVGVVDQVAAWGENVTFVRKSTINSPTVSYAIADWDEYATDTFTYLGSHTFGGGSSITYVSGYENLDVANVTSYAVSGLTAATDYYYVVRAYNANGTSANSNEIDVETLAGNSAPVITSPTATAITATSATLGGNITSDGGSAITERGTVWKTSAGVTITDNKLAEGGTATGVFTHNRTSLPAGTKVFYRAYATNGIGTALSDEASFSTLAGEPSAHPTAFSATANSSNSITVSWTDSDASGYLIKGSNVGYSNISAPVDGTAETNGLLVQNVASGNGTFQFTGLTASTTYYFKIYPYNGSDGTINYKTVGAQEASATTLEGPALPKVFFSEYLEGSSNNKAIEIYNGESTPLDLTKLTVNLYSNGSPTATESWTGTSGTLDPGNTIILRDPNAALPDITTYAYATSLVTYYNGDDALAIFYDSQMTDVFGDIGNDPGSAWSVAGTAGATENHTLIRKLSVTKGNITPLGSFGTTAEDSEWIIMDQDYTGNIGEFGTAFINYSDTDWAVAANWDAGVPVANRAAIVPGSTMIGLEGNAEVANLLIKEEGYLSIDGSLTVSGTLRNDAGAVGLEVSSTVNGTGSLIQSTAGVNATVQRYMNNADWNNWKDGWHFLSSPVLNQAISTEFTTDPYDFYLWNEPTNEWINYKNQSGGNGTAPYFDVVNGSNNFTMGRGYMAAYDVSGTKEFSGVLNVADVAVSGLGITNTSFHRSWHLIGNPFSSALTWDAIGDWNLSNIAGVAKIWNEDDQGYTDILSASPMVIPATNGFMVQVTNNAGGSLTIPASKRQHSAQAFYKSTASGFMLTARSHEAGNAQESRIIENPDATTGFDVMLDGEFLAGYGPSFYSLAGDVKLSTNSLPQISAETEIPFNFIKNEGTQFSITATGLEGITATPYLFDLKTGSSQNLKENAVYNFTAAQGDAANRFVLKFGAVGIGDTPTVEATTIYSHGQSLYISSTQSADAQVSVYNVTGQQVYGSRMMLDGQKQITLNVITGWYIVKVRTQEGIATQKVFIKAN